MLKVVVYHYVRDLPNTAFPRLKGLLTDRFAAQVRSLRQQYEMASLSVALDFLEGKYAPRRDLCLLTFDDGLKEHWQTVTPILADQGIEGLFFIPTLPLETSQVLPVHMNHFLLAGLNFPTYREQCLVWLKQRGVPADLASERQLACSTYRWDSAEIAELKYFLNYKLDRATRDKLLRAVFTHCIGDEKDFARQLYVNWEEARQMQEAGMVIGGHSHRHLPLSTLSQSAQRDDLLASFGLLKRRLKEQAAWPFSYPYGTPSAVDATTIRLVREVGFSCAFTTDAGTNPQGTGRFQLRRDDTNDV